MKKCISVYIAAAVLLACAAGCAKHNEHAQRLAEFATEINQKPGTELGNGTVLAGCEYAEGDSAFVYLLQVPDNRFAGIESDSLHRNFKKTVESDKMAKIVRTLGKAGVGLEYRLTSADTVITVSFTADEIQAIGR